MTWILSIFNGPSGFSANSTAEDVTAGGIHGTGLTAIVTGATSGIGLETARVIALRGVHIVMPVRNIESEYCSNGFPLNILIYSAFYAYGQSKLANVLHAKELARRLKEEGGDITANALHPGVVNTNLARHQGFFISAFSRLANVFLKNTEQGAATSCYLALHPQVKCVTGEYFADSNLSKASKYANDPELAKKLWNFSLSLSGSK